VRLERDRERLTAPRLDYLRPAGRIDAPHGLAYENPNLSLRGEAARWWIAGPRAHLREARYRLRPSGARGRARDARLASDRLVLEQADYTTCPGERPAWRLSARRLTLEPRRNTGRARNVVLHLGPLPVAWIPYLQFPLGGRKSGLLPPTLDTSTQRGREIAQPLYLNLAPHYDATLTARHMSRRGPALGGEFRYLGRHRQGRLNGDWLPRDRLTGQDRRRLAWDHRQRLGPWRLDLRWRQVSDRDYLRDLGGGLASANRPYLERHARLAYRRGPWQADLLAQDYQVLDPGLSEPLRRLPRLTLRGDGGTWTLRAEHSRFQRGDALVARRNRLQPALTPTLERPYAHLRPHLGAVLLQYPGGTALTVPRLALDAALYLERRRPGLDETLSPRLYWTYTPYREQTALPRLDTAPLPTGSARLFTPARYAGGDRIGDRHSLTLALDYQRRGRLEQTFTLAALAQLADQRVALPGERVKRAGWIEPVFLWRGRRGDALSAALEMDWPHGGSAPNQTRFGLNYDTPRLAGRLDYQYDAGRVDQVHLRLWRRAGPWQGGVASRWDLAEGRELETRAGIGYGTCCWSLAVHARRYRIGAADTLYQRLTLTLELAGLGRTGRGLRERLGL